MSRRNLHLLMAFTVVCLACALRVSRFGRVVAYAMNEIDHRYLERVDRRELFEGAMEGMMNRLDDYSAYIAPELVAPFQETIDQEFGGVGVEILLDPKTKQLTVASPLVDTPAYKAGIRAGDKILRIDGKSTQGLSLEDASDRMRGKPGEVVVLTILHANETEPEDVPIVREMIQVRTVLGDTRNVDGTWNYFLEGEGYDRIGYLRISAFSEHTDEELEEALDWLVEHDVRALILDLRNNPGGLLDAAIRTCDRFVASGEIVSIRGRDGRIERTFAARKEGTFSGFPMAVLVNQLSASASEIVAACLQDHKRAVVVGEQSYGKGTIQDLIRLQPNQGMLKLTTASYWRPSGKDIHRPEDAPENGQWGVAPDEGYEVRVEGEEVSRLREWRYRRDLYRPDGENNVSGENAPPDDYFDPQLAKAIEYVQQRIAVR